MVIQDKRSVLSRLLMRRLLNSLSDLSRHLFPCPESKTDILAVARILLYKKEKEALSAIVRFFVITYKESTIHRLARRGGVKRISGKRHP
uniref:Uncharacterized protein n=1 Tax=Megaselia scalaris TaxID=36166 RepID=T1GA12_MEGSC